MPPKDDHPLQGEMLQGTLDLLILQTLVRVRRTATRSPTSSNIVRKTFYRWSMVRCIPPCTGWRPAEWIASFWGTSENNRKARYYRLTASAANN